MSKDTARYLPIEEARDAEHPAREPPKAVTLSVFSLWVTGVNAFAVLSVNGLFALLSVNAVCAVLSCNSAFSVLSLNSVFSGARVRCVDALVCARVTARRAARGRRRHTTRPSHHAHAPCSLQRQFRVRDRVQRQGVRGVSLI